MKKIVIAKDFSVTPGFRYETDGPKSGEEFRKKFLEPLFEDEESDEQILIDLDGAAGYATSFLEEVFGGLARKYGVEVCIRRLEIKSDEEPFLIDEINEYIENAGA